MRLWIVCGLFLLFCLIANVALASDIVLNERTIEFKIVEPCDVLFTEGQVSFGWNHCEGANALVTITNEDLGCPIKILFLAGGQRLSDLCGPEYAEFHCMKCTNKRPDVYCCDFEYCSWYCYCGTICYCGDQIDFYAYLPCSMALDIIDVY